MATIDKTKFLGIDVSRWQDNDSTPQQVDWVKARKAGTKFCFIKCTQRLFIDGDFIYNWKKSKEAGIPRGTYCYLNYDISYADQARFYARALKESGDLGELEAVADIEYRPMYSRAYDYLWGFLQVLEQELPGKKLGIYCGPYYWQEMCVQKWGYYRSVDAWKKYTLWGAHYETKALGYLGIDKNTGKEKWVDILPWGRDGWTYWQFGTPVVGREFGMESEELDCNYYNGTEEQFRTVYKLGETQPELPLPELTIEERVTILEKKVAKAHPNI